MKNRIRVYRIKHIPTGLYWKAGTFSNLSKVGKLYVNKPDLSQCINVKHNWRILESTPADFVLEKYWLIRELK